MYLVGAGASHACADAGGSPHGILMRHLSQDLNDKVRDLYEQKYKGQDSLNNIVNTVIIDDDTDIEHVITFLDESASALHRQFANDLRKAFENVLRERLEKIEDELSGAPTGLYSALLDMYQVDGCPDELGGILTLNYDEYIEDAAAGADGLPVDFGVYVHGVSSAMPGLKLLKLHGSFGWKDAWPILNGKGDTTLWIPPGIQKAKERYPFNVLWGLAREMLDCDVLRIIGCRLAPNDWDLISLIFTTRHANSIRRPYAIELIDAPLHAAALQKSYPYLEIQSLLDVEPIGPRLVGELLGRAPQRYASLTPAEQERAKNDAGEQNWFLLWLTHQAEVLYVELGSITTPLGAFERLLK